MVPPDDAISNEKTSGVDYNFALSDRYTKPDGIVYLTGMQAQSRLLSKLGQAIGLTSVKPKSIEGAVYLLRIPRTVYLLQNRLWVNPEIGILSL